MDYVYNRERFDDALYNIFSKYAKSVSLDFSENKVFSSDELEAAGFLPEQFSTQQKLEGARIFNDCARGGQSFEEFVKYMEFSSKGIKTKGYDSFAKILSEEVLGKPRKFQGEASFEDICSFFENGSLSTYRPLLKKINKQAKLASKGKLDEDKAIFPTTFMRMISAACNINNAFQKTEAGDRLFQNQQANGVFSYNHITNSYINGNVASNLLNKGYTEEDLAKIDEDIYKCAEKHDMRLGRRKASDRISLRERFTTYRSKDFQTNFIPSNAVAYDDLTKVFRSNLLAPYALEEISPELHQNLEADIPVFAQDENNNLSGQTEDNIARAREYGKVIGDVSYSFSKLDGIDADNIELAKNISDEFATRGGYVMDKVEGLSTLAEVAMSDEVVRNLPRSEKIFRAYAPNVDQNDIMQVYEPDLDLPVAERRYVGSGFVKNNGIMFPVDNLPISKKQNAVQGDNIQYELDVKNNIENLKEDWEKKFHISFEQVEENDIHFGKNPLATAFVERANAEYIKENKPQIENFDDVKQAMKEQYEANIGFNEAKKQPKEEVAPAEQEKPLNRKPYGCKDTLSVQQAYEILMEALVRSIEQFKVGNVSETASFDEIERQAKLSRQKKAKTAKTTKEPKAKKQPKTSSKQKEEKKDITKEQVENVMNNITKETAENVAAPAAVQDAKPKYKMVLDVEKGKLVPQKIEEAEEVKKTETKTAKKQSKSHKAMTEEERMKPNMAEIMACRSVDRLIIDAETVGFLTRDEVAKYLQMYSKDKDKNKALLKEVKELVLTRFKQETEEIKAEAKEAKKNIQVISEVTEEAKEEIKHEVKEEKVEQPAKVAEKVEETVPAELDLSGIEAPAAVQKEDFTISEKQAADMITLADKNIISPENTFQIMGMGDSKQEEVKEQKPAKKPTAKERLEAEQQERLEKAIKRAKRASVKKAKKEIVEEVSEEIAPKQEDKTKKSSGKFLFNGRYVSREELENLDEEEVVSFDEDDDEFAPSK